MRGGTSGTNPRQDSAHDHASQSALPPHTSPDRECAPQSIFPPLASLEHVPSAGLRGPHCYPPAESHARDTQLGYLVQIN
jgi:hypothetical protein